MTEILTESFCERCGTRYTFESAAPGTRRLGGLKVLGRGLKQFVMSDSTSLDEAIASVRSDIEHDATNHQLDAFHKTFRYCMSCRQYTCANCWNEAESRCQSCAPIEIARPEPVVVDGSGAESQNGLIGLESERDQVHVAALDIPTPFALVEPPAAVVEIVAPPEPADSVESIATVEAITQVGLTTPATLPVEAQGEWIGDAEPAIGQAVDDEWSGLPIGSYFDATRSPAEPMATDDGLESDDTGPLAAVESTPVAEPAAVAEPFAAVESTPVAEPAAVADPVAAIESTPVAEPAAVAEPFAAPPTPPFEAPAPIAATRPPAAAPQWPTSPRWPTGAPGDTSDPAPVDALAALIARKSTDAMWAQSNLPLLQPPAAAAPTAAVKACGSCGTSLSANARFCRRCGTSQP